MSCELQQKARQKNLIALRTYGMTETFGQVSTQTLQQFRNGSEGSGNPLDGCDIRVQKGRILIQSTSIASGILDGGEEQELECDGDWLLTQDLGTQLASGEIVVQGRRDLAILSGGEVVHLEAIERKYEAAFSDLDIVVVPCRSAEWGACAVIVYTPRRSTFSSSHEITAEKLSDFAHKQLPPPMRPKFFFAADTIPRTTLGKAQRKKLQQWVESRVSEIGS